LDNEKFKPYFKRLNELGIPVAFIILPFQWNITTYMNFPIYAAYMDDV